MCVTIKGRLCLCKKEGISIVKKWRRQERLTGYTLLAPAILIFLLMGFASIVMSIALSFTYLPRGSIIQNAKFTGFSNYKEFLLGGSPVISEMFRNAIANNFVIAIALVLFVIPIGLVIAYMLTKAVRGRKIITVLLLVPMVVSSTSIYYVWAGIYEPDGALNQILRAIGLADLAAKNGWLGETATALPAMIALLIWSGIPEAVILYLSKIQTLDTSLFDAAALDGANTWQKIRYVIWPLLRPITVIVVIQNINRAFQVFDQVYIMTGGGPAGATQVINMLVYNEAFQNPNGNIGRANAMGWIIFIITFVLSLISMKANKDET